MVAEPFRVPKTPVAPRRKTGSKKLPQHRLRPHLDMPDHKGLVLGPKLHGEHACAIYFDRRATWQVSGRMQRDAFPLAAGQLLAGPLQRCGLLCAALGRPLWVRASIHHAPEHDPGRCSCPTAQTRLPHTA